LSPESADPDTLCAEGLRCVGCKCQNCPQSGSGRLGQASEKVLNPPLVFVIDTTKSVKPDKDSIFNLTGKVTDRIMKDRINIPRYQLISFNDFGPAINLNVKLEVRLRLASDDMHPGLKYPASMMASPVRAVRVQVMHHGRCRKCSVFLGGLQH
jgi:hypothetical protein